MLETGFGSELASGSAGASVAAAIPLPPPVIVPLSPRPTLPSPFPFVVTTSSAVLDTPVNRLPPSIPITFDPAHLAPSSS
ncbi:hypothetical protein NLJ89_g1 [Agrocybe chaxingu]|uniref:Uncharacterized protein n=1 Tax=Agrocybe chaxingu TaxID=84603 RepID=A0A9W8N312_9AGAR|nr:hypothetical protein NLJ89_g1 [Agrocybe chaxingu]